MTTGHSDTPLWKKLGVKPGWRLALLDAPEELNSALKRIPSGVTVLRRPKAPVDTLIAFVSTRVRLHRHLNKAPTLLAAHGGFWIAWPKQSSGIPSELDFTAVQQAGLDAGLVDNKKCAISDVWSGLRFVVRKEQREDWPAC